jgi:hypothetical protein
VSGHEHDDDDIEEGETVSKEPIVKAHLVRTIRPQRLTGNPGHNAMDPYMSHGDRVWSLVPFGHGFRGELRFSRTVNLLTALN